MENKKRLYAGIGISVAIALLPFLVLLLTYDGSDYIFTPEVKLVITINCTIALLILYHALHKFYTGE